MDCTGAKLRALAQSRCSMSLPDDDRAREIMNAFFAPTREGIDHNPCALIVSGGRHE